jgi:hypothetical protein
MGRKGALLGASVAVVGMSLLGGAVANAGVGSGPGQLSFSPASGSLSATNVTWSTSTACPSGFLFATLEIIASDNGPGNPDTTIIGAQTLSGTQPISNASLIAGTSIAQIEQIGLFGPSTSGEAAVMCSTGPGGTGTTQFVQSEFFNFQADGTTYTTSATPQFGGAAATPTVTLTATPNPVQVGNTVTLTATVTSSGTPVTTGAVQFESGGTAIGTPVALSASGVATTTTTFTSAATDSLTAVFQSSNTAQFTNATSNTVSENVTTSAPNTASELITVSVAPSGSFSFTGTTNATAALTESGLTATGTLVPVQVSDTRTGLAPNPSVPSLVNGFNGFPGWSVVGQATDFTNPNSQPAGDIPAANFNWTPTSAASGDFTLGGASTTGLGAAQTLANAATGHGDGTFNLGANLSLAIPASAPAGGYTSTLTMTANPTANFS